MKNLGISFSRPKVALLLPVAFLIFGFCNLTSSHNSLRGQVGVSCMVKGKVLRAGGTVFAHSLEASYTPGGSLRIKGKAGLVEGFKKYASSIDLFIAAVDGPGDYHFGTDPRNLAAYANSDAAPATFFSTDLHHTGRLRITKIDIKNRLIVGYFEFQAAGNHDQNQTISISNGKFVLHYEEGAS